MEKVIEDLIEDLRDVMEDKPLKTLRKETGDLADIRLCRMIVFSLQWASVGYQSALRLAGMKFGKRMGTICERTELSLILESIKKIIETLRGGKVEIEVIAETKEARFKIYESSLTSQIPNISQNLCFFEEGFIEGYLDGIISQKGIITVAGQEFSVSQISVEENRCIGLGDDFCGFLIKF